MKNAFINFIFQSFPKARGKSLRIMIVKFSPSIVRRKNFLFSRHVTKTFQLTTPFR